MDKPYTTVCEAYDKMYKGLPDRKVLKASAAIPMLMEGDRTVPEDKCTVGELIRRMSELEDYEELVVCDASDEGICLCDKDGITKYVPFCKEEETLSAEPDEKDEKARRELHDVYAHNLDDSAWHL